MAVMLLFVLHYPKRILLVWGILPAPAWLLGAIWVVADMLGMAGGGRVVAYEAHLAGALYGFVYFRTRWTLAALWPKDFSLSRLRPKPRLRVHDPDKRDDALSAEVDDILRKIRQHGQDSLTAKERRILEEASRRYQQKRR